MGDFVLNWKFLVPLQPVGCKPPFFLVHGSGELARQIDANQPVYGLMPHGLDGRPAPLSVEEMAADYIAEIRMVQADGPYLIGGYSFGGLLAFEVARQLKAQDQEVRLLILLDPTTPANGKIRLEASSPISKFSRHLRMHWGNLWLLSAREKIAYLTERIGWRLTLLKDTVKMASCQAFLISGRRVPVGLRVFYFMSIARLAARRYIPGVYCGHVILLPTEKPEKNGSSYWSHLVAGRLEIHEMPGAHLDAIHGPHVTAWSEQLRTCLENATTSTTPPKRIST